MDIQELSILVDEGARSEAVSISSTSAQSSAMVSDTALVTLTTAAFVRQGADPTALATGVDIYLLADITYRVAVKKGNKLAFKTASASGTAYITPGV